MVNLLLRLWSGGIVSLASLMLCVSAHAWGGDFRVVSDIDDTVKITHTQSSVDSAVRGLFGQDVFAGMASLYQNMTRNTAAVSSVTYLSGSPEFLQRTLRELLVYKKGFPYGRFLLKDWLKGQDIFEYKMAALRKIAEESEEPLILVGDDTEKDPEIYTTFAEQNPGRVLKIYIRQNMEHRRLPNSVVPFFSAFEMALEEFEAGRLSEAQALEVGQSILAESDSEQVIPRFAFCPDNELSRWTPGPATAARPVLLDLLDRVAGKIFQICIQRQGHPLLSIQPSLLIQH